MKLFKLFFVLFIMLHLPGFAAYQDVVNEHAKILLDLKLNARDPDHAKYFRGKDDRKAVQNYASQNWAKIQGRHKENMKKANALKFQGDLYRKLESLFSEFSKGTLAFQAWTTQEGRIRYRKTEPTQRHPDDPTAPKVATKYEIPRLFILGDDGKAYAVFPDKEYEEDQRKDIRLMIMKTSGQMHIGKNLQNKRVVFKIADRASDLFGKGKFKGALPLAKGVRVIN